MGLLLWGGEDLVESVLRLQNWRGELGQNKSTSLQLLESLKLSLIGIRIGKTGEKWKGGIGLNSKLEKYRPLPHETQERQMHMENNDDTALYIWNCSLGQPQLTEIQVFVLFCF